MSISVAAPAKLNLSLDVIGRRDDGYHELRTVMQTVDWCDTVTVDFSDDGDISLQCDNGAPEDERNTAYRAAALFRKYTGRQEGYRVIVKKHIPMQAGMAGGSADAAAVLWALSRLTGVTLRMDELLSLGAQIGADVPFCLRGGTALATGIGTELTPLPPLPTCAFVVVKPDGGVSTPEAYRLLDSMPTLHHPDVERQCAAIRDGNIGAVAATMGNSFEIPLSLPHTATVVDLLKQHGAAGAMLTGSGSAVCGLFLDQAVAEQCAAAVRPVYPQTRVCLPTASRW